MIIIIKNKIRYSFIYITLIEQEPLNTTPQTDLSCTDDDLHFGDDSNLQVNKHKTSY